MKNMNMHDMATIIAIYFINSELIRSLFNKYESVNSITFVATKSHPIFAERMLLTCKDVLDTRIKPNMQWADLIYVILLTYNNKIVHSAIPLTPKEASGPSNEQEAYANLNWKASATENTVR